MSIFFMDSMAHYTTNAQEVTKWDANYFQYPIASSGAFGYWGLRGNNDGTGLQKSFPAVTTLEFSAYFIAGVTAGSFFQFSTTGGPQVSFWIYGDGTIRVDQGGIGGTELGRTAAAAVSFSVQHHIYTKVVFSDTVGTVTIKIDGTTVLSLTGKDTAAQSTADCTTLRLWGILSSNQSDVIWSHVALADTSGDITGRPRVQAVFPDGAGNYSQWSLTGAASHYQAVGETSPDDDTSYVSDSVAGHRDSYTYSNFLSTTDRILAVAVVPRARTDDGASRTMKTFVRAGGVDYDHANTVSVPGSYGYLQQIYQVNPATGVAWTPTEVNAIEAGIKVVA